MCDVLSSGFWAVGSIRDASVYVAATGLKDRLLHRDAGDRDAVRQQDLRLLEPPEAVGLVQRQARERGDEREPVEALAPRGGLALLEDPPPEPAPRPVGPDEHRAHACRLGRGVERALVAGRAVLDDHRARLDRLEDAADADAAGQVDVRADLRT